MPLDNDLDNVPNKVSIETAARALERSMRQARSLGVSHSKAFTILSRVYSEPASTGVTTQSKSSTVGPTSVFSLIPSREEK